MKSEYRRQNTGDGMENGISVPASYMSSYFSRASCLAALGMTCGILTRDSLFVTPVSRLLSPSLLPSVS